MIGVVEGSTTSALNEALRTLVVSLDDELSLSHITLPNNQGAKGLKVRVLCRWITSLEREAPIQQDGHVKFTRTPCTVGQKSARVLHQALPYLP